MPTILQRCWTYFSTYRSSFPSSTNISKYVPSEKPRREKDDNAIIGIPRFALLALIFFFKFQVELIQVQMF